MQIWAPIVAVSVTVIVCLLIFFGVRHSRIKADVEIENLSDYEVPYAETQSEEPYQNDAENLENEEIYDEPPP